MISSSGAEGISLTCVRRVHIAVLNFIRVDQVLGRAICMRSHALNFHLKKPVVEQYLYLATLPDGNTPDLPMSMAVQIGLKLMKQILRQTLNKN